MVPAVIDRCRIVGRKLRIGVRHIATSRVAGRRQGRIVALMGQAVVEDTPRQIGWVIRPDEHAILEDRLTHIPAIEILRGGKEQAIAHHEVPVAIPNRAEVVRALPVEHAIREKKAFRLTC